MPALSPDSDSPEAEGGLRPIDWLSRSACRLAWLMNAIAVGALGLTAAILIYEIAARFLFNRPTGWSDVAAAYLLPPIVFLGGAYALVQDAHIRIDSLYTRLAERRRLWLGLFNETVGLLMLGLLSWFSFLMVMRTHRGETMTTAGTYIFPEWWGQTVLPIGLAAMAIVQLAIWVCALRALTRAGAAAAVADSDRA